MTTAELNQARQQAAKYLPPQTTAPMIPRGVHPNKGRFVACIRIDGKAKHLGRFKTIAEAEKAYLAAKAVRPPDRRKKP